MRSDEVEIHCLLSVGRDRIPNALELISEAAKFNVFMHVIWRGGLPQFEKTPQTYVSLTVEDCSLSAARNILLRNMMEDSAISKDAVIFLADDDGQLPSDFRERLEQVFLNDVDWILGSYGPDPEEIDTNRFPRHSTVGLSRKEILRISSSLGIYVRYSLLMQAGLFDEDLGLGSRISVGEDTEFALRLNRIAGSTAYDPRLLQIHPYKRRSQNQNLDNLSFLFYMAFRSPTYLYSAFRYSFSSIISKKIATIDVVKTVRKEFTFRFFGR